VIGGFMVDLALRHAPEGDFFDALCETSACLPDVIPLLSPCTVGNGRLKILDIGRFSLTFYEKIRGAGVRVFLDVSKVDAWPEIKGWHFRLACGEEQNPSLLLEQIREAGEKICTLQKVVVKLQVVRDKKCSGKMAVCPICREAYPEDGGGICRACNGNGPYRILGPVDKPDSKTRPCPKALPVEETAGGCASHGMTLIIPGNEKNPAVKNGQIIQMGDMCRLQKMERQPSNVGEESEPCSGWIHKDESTPAFARKMAGEGVSFSDAPREGKMNVLAARDGLFVVDKEGLEMFNMIPGAVCASRWGFSVVTRGDILAVVTTLPLYTRQTHFNKAMSVLKEGPLFHVLPMRRARTGILVTGVGKYQGRPRGSFIPIITGKLEAYGCKVAQTHVVPGDRIIIRQAIGKLLHSGIDLLVTTAGLSVDPDDVMRQGLLDSGATDMLCGMPVIPGAMTLLAHIGHVQVIGVPDCALYSKTTSFDLLLPRLLADRFPVREDLVRLCHGALCLECDDCRFPCCAFGK
ncbi:MAG: FmdE family protein, partial [Deltaproteobacteria bacterium]|nr:FmdE family protein [Deltaproteobacteria bacterium]